MTTKNANAESTAGANGAPIKRLVLRRETVRSLNVRTGMKTGELWKRPGVDSDTSVTSQPSQGFSVSNPSVFGDSASAGYTP